MTVARCFGPFPARLIAAVVAISAISGSPTARAEGPSSRIDVTGRVLDDKGQPIAGARVSWSTDLDSQGMARDTSTGADGRFVLEHVTDDPIVLTVEAAGHSPDLKKLPAREGMAPIEFRLGPGHAIRGRLFDREGHPVRDVPVAAADWRGYSSLKWGTRTDAEGRFRWDEAPADLVGLRLQRSLPEGLQIGKVVPDGPEYRFLVRSPLRLRGRVLDAETRRPIRAFRIVGGGCWGEKGPVLWYDDLSWMAFGISYEAAPSFQTSHGLIRVEAEGYEPAVSRRLRRDDGEAIVPFALRRGPGYSGTVRLPDGTPIEGAHVVRATGAPAPASIQNGRIRAGDVDRWVTRTWPSGRFDLPATKPPFTVVALHDRGMAEVEVDAATKGELALTLRPWGRIEGVLRFGSRVALQEPLWLDPRYETARLDRVFWSGWTRTDNDGRFAFERIPPGSARLSRQVIWPEGFGFNGASPTAELTIEPGKTTRLTLGAGGRAIVGKAIVPEGIDGFVFGRGELARKPADPKASPFVFRVEPNGSFRIESIGPGTYELRIVANERRARGPWLGGGRLASIDREVVVEPIPGGSSDQPIDLGAIRLEAAKPGPPRSQPEPKR